eukprot:g5664.t1
MDSESLVAAKKMEQDLKRKCAEVVKLKEEREVLKSRCADYALKEEELQAKLTQALSQEGTKSVQSTSHEEDQEFLQEHVEMLELTVSQLQRALKELREKYETLRNQSTQDTAKLRQVEQLCDTLKSENAEHSDAALGQLRAVELDLHKIQLEYATLQKEHGTAYAKSMVAQSEAEEAEKRRVIQEEQLESYKFTHAKATGKIVTLDTELSEVKSQWRQVLTVRDEYAERCETLMQERENLDERMSLLEDKAIAETIERNSHEKKQLGLKKELARLVRKSEKEQSDLQNENAKLHKEVDSLRQYAPQSRYGKQMAVALSVDIRKRLTEFYTRHDPQRLEEGIVDILVDKYHGSTKDDLLMLMVQNSYFAVGANNQKGRDHKRVIDVNLEHRLRAELDDLKRMHTLELGHIAQQQQLQRRELDEYASMVGK